VSSEQVARAAFEGVVCGLLDGLDALAAHAPVNRVVLVGGGARSAAYRDVAAALCSLPVSVADADQAVATGACVQAAAIALGVDHAAVVRQWGLGHSESVAGQFAGDAATEIRSRYRALREREYG
jgi:xylulokinase